MKSLKSILLFLALAVTPHTSNAQIVTIPDAGFVSFLNDNYSAAMSGNQLNTSYGIITFETSLTIPSSYGIIDLTGLEHFENLLILNIANNTLLSSMPPLPNTLYSFDRSNTPNLPMESMLPATLEIHIMNNCGTIPIGDLPPFHEGLKQLLMENIGLDTLPALPLSLVTLHAGGNNFTSLGSFPVNLNLLALADCPNLTTLTGLPDSMHSLTAPDCNISYIDHLPDTITNTLDLSNNNLSSIPNWPTGGTWIVLNDNQIDFLPPLTGVVADHLNIANNNLTCLPFIPSTIGGYIQCHGNSFTCIPNLAPSIPLAFQTYPLCQAFDPIDNPYGCMAAEGVEGHTFKDQNSNCTHQSTDGAVANVPITVYDDMGIIISQSSSLSSGRYYFDLPVGTYDVVIDTLNKPYTFDCINPGIDSTVQLTALDPLIQDVNFSLTCKPGFDVGTQAISIDGLVFPGQTHSIQAMSGDISNYYGWNCSAGIAGSVTIIVSGPVTYINETPGSLVPSVSGNVFTYNISDFGNIDMNSDFGLNFTTDTLAQTGDDICVNVLVTPNIGDLNPANNDYTFCYSVINSYDPNNKQVYPQLVEPGYSDYLTYTINFQNTGSAPAFNIRLEDTLSDLLDPSTFEVIDYSHNMHYNLTDKKLAVYFPNIMLVDSTTSEPDSKGHITYRIKPNGNLVDGEEVENTAYIFFDFNPAIVTNTSITQVQIDESGIESLTENQLLVYPNPSEGKFRLSTSEDILAIHVFDQQGREIFIDFNSQTKEIDLTQCSPGIYLLNVLFENDQISMKLIKK